jgi:hypothetical protein
MGECRAAPPSIFPVLVESSPLATDKRPMQGYQSSFPPMNSSGWCRQWGMRTDGEA